MSVGWLDRRVLVTAGTGGVGKTTIAAAIGLGAARRGRKTLVLTIDPARRLADALGLERIDHTPQRIPTERIGEAGAALHAMMLDTKRTFDELVERLSPDAESRERILQNPIYRNLTDALAGSREYSAMEKLHQVYASGEYDLVVLDTPPASHALDFLAAPRRMTGFLDGTFPKLLLRPAAAVGRTGFRLFRFGSELALNVLQRITGLEFLKSMSEFVLAFEAMFDGFSERARQVEQLLRDPACGFVLVAGPDPVQVERATLFWRQLEAERIQLAGVVVNRVRSWSNGSVPEHDATACAEALAWLERHFDHATAEVLVDTAQRHARFAERDAEMCERLLKALPVAEDDAHRVRLAAGDVDAHEGLSRIAAQLFGEAHG